MKQPGELILRLGLLAANAAGATCQDASARHRSVPPQVVQERPEAAQPDAPARERVVANPLVSRGKRVVGWSPPDYADPRKANDGDAATVWQAGKPTPERPAWLALDVGEGPKRLLLTWSAAGSFNYDETTYGSPGAYRIETSPDSTNGIDGAWRTVVTVPAVTTHCAEHAFDFVGQRWVRLVVTAAPISSPNGVQIDEISLHDASRGIGDTWFFMGDSITAMAFGRASSGESGFSARVHARHPSRFPATLNGGVGGDKSDDGLRHVDEWLAQAPDARFWALGYGTNDAAGDAVDATRFRANLQAIINRVRAAGRIPLLATIPFAADGQHRNIPRFNQTISELERANGLPAGPDLYAWFHAHPEELRDGLHPDAAGIRSINRLWADAADALYEP